MITRVTMIHVIRMFQFQILKCTHSYTKQMYTHLNQIGRILFVCYYVGVVLDDPL